MISTVFRVRGIKVREVLKVRELQTVFLDFVI